MQSLYLCKTGHTGTGGALLSQGPGASTAAKCLLRIGCQNRKPGERPREAW